MTLKAIRTFTVRVTLPEPLAPLLDIAMNLRWSWDPPSRALFRWVDPGLWQEVHHDPVHLLGTVGQHRLEELIADANFMQFLGEVHQDLQNYLEEPRWFQSQSSPLKSVAYFSPEFGISEALPQYSGGLGVLAGDHLKAASSLGVPLTGVGLFYRQGYFRQELNAEGWQQERYVNLDPHAMALTSEEPMEMQLAGKPLRVHIWRAQVGRIPLYLMDTDVEPNDDEHRSITDRLYGGWEEHRIQQEILLGIGGVKALRAVGADPQIFHTNEGHAGFLGFARIEEFIKKGLSWDEAVEAVRAGTIFTTHTPVAAGIDRFPAELMAKYFAAWADEMGVPFEKVMRLGHEPHDPPDAPFNMALMGLRLAGRSNGVSRLHGEVSRRMFSSVWPGVPTDEVPITSVTNGVHARTWVFSEMAELLDRYVSKSWEESGAKGWLGVKEVPDEELWAVQNSGRSRLVDFARRRLKESALAKGASQTDVLWCDEALDPHVLTLGWGRRFAAYKRPDLLLRDIERLRRLLLDERRPVQIIFAGKAHPADDFGKEMIRRIVQFSRREDIRHRFAFIEDYDIHVARMMYQGVDVWINNPRRPLEACGTSGEKAALNGALNCSIRDGWWDEMFDGENGWAIASAETYEDLEMRDSLESASLYDVIERQIVPTFYERDERGVPALWVSKIKASLSSLGGKVLAARMVREYLSALYEPAAVRADALISDEMQRAKELAAFKRRVLAAWETVQVEKVESDGGIIDLGGRREVRAVVMLGQLNKDDVEVQLLHGQVGAGDELSDPSVVTMELTHVDGKRTHYRGEFACERAGRYGFAVRVVAAHPETSTFADIPNITWG